MARLLSVNVGLPRDMEWKGRTVHTGIRKDPVRGRCRVGRLNLDGDGQGDLAGHGGEQRAVFVYQIESHRYWEEQLKTTFVMGQFGENFTIQGLPDDTVCIGDRYQIGSALFEVTQPRVTCYRVGIRTNEPRMPALLTSRGRPGFYFRVLREGEVGAGDEIVKIGEAKERMTVAEINALLYSPDHPRDRLQRALRIEALSPGWRSSFEALLQSQATAGRGGNAGLAPAAAAHPVAPGFRTLTVAAIDREAADVLSLTMHRADGQPLPSALPGQYVVLRLPRGAGGTPLFRSYSLSGPLSTECYRISVKIEPNGEAGNYLQERVHAGDALDVSSPRGSFVLQPSDRPVVLLSAGIGATPVLAMLHALAAAGSTRQILWLHAARDGRHHPFAAEVRGLMQSLAHGRSHVCYSRPGANDTMGKDFDSAGHLSRSAFDALDVSREADVYLCGPDRFMEDMKAALATLGFAPARIHLELFNGSESRTPGVVGGSRRAAHVPQDDADTGPLVSFARSGIAAHWKPSCQSILELAEACDVPVRWSCRTGVCHNCESGLVSGTVVYEPEPLDMPADGNLLVCCARPVRDIVVDL
ncbi:MOSC and FAD-binding oxidoreductase domain-containing protein [Bradyrhizobium sp. NP1]|uniref:MOSC and FAD-binding oxidoreductase domain-containing protein n=1 Tax=Bradyrhizobium sp. NP1 TaxID=3049772 RepID=UPI0025A4E52D|nr:MOSC and FAD-binding oxidoreductase domain-containing protein [Bradyrhizobium sp. NP1]WJR82016.1 MOSC and FAD-binding oxidoreductase domain-containing protein [Bradyrhizobium sp. NP1]